MIINNSLNIITVTGWVVSITQDEAKALLFCLTAFWSPIIYIIHFKCHHHHHHQHHSSSLSLSAAAAVLSNGNFSHHPVVTHFLKTIITIWICWQRGKCKWHPVLNQGSHNLVLAASTRNCDYSWLCQCVPLWRSPTKMKGAFVCWGGKTHTHTLKMHSNNMLFGTLESGSGKWTQVTKVCLYLKRRDRQRSKMW